MTINRIYILNHYEASCFSPDKTNLEVYAMIRITSGEFIPLAFGDNFSAIKCFQFDDVVDEKSAPSLLLNIGKEHEGIIMFDEIMAKDMHTFIDEIKNKTDVLIVHCDAGISRSSATAWCIAKYLDLDHVVKTIEGNSGGYLGRYQPNLRIKKILSKELNIPMLREQMESGWLPGRA